MALPRSETMILGVASASGNWPEAAMAFAGIALVGNVVIVAVWQLLAAWRTRMAGSREAAYRQLEEPAIEAQARTAAAVEQVFAGLRQPREGDE
jgi:hypothetical protein